MKCRGGEKDTDEPVGQGGGVWTSLSRPYRNATGEFQGIISEGIGTECWRWKTKEDEVPYDDTSGSGVVTQGVRYDFFSGPDE